MTGPPESLTWTVPGRGEAGTDQRPPASRAIVGLHGNRPIKILEGSVDGVDENGRNRDRTGDLPLFRWNSLQHNRIRAGHTEVDLSDWTAQFTTADPLAPSWPHVICILRQHDAGALWTDDLWVMSERSQSAAASRISNAHVRINRPSGPPLRVSRDRAVTPGFVHESVHTAATSKCPNDGLSSRDQRRKCSTPTSSTHPSPSPDCVRDGLSGIREVGSG